MTMFNYIETQEWMSSDTTEVLLLELTQKRDDALGILKKVNPFTDPGAVVRAQVTIDLCEYILNWGTAQFEKIQKEEQP